MFLRSVRVSLVDRPFWSATRYLFAAPLGVLLFALPGWGDQVRMRDGSVLNGSILKIESGKVHLQTGFAGALELAQDQVEAVETLEPVQVVLPSGSSLRGTLQGQGGSLQVRTPEGIVSTEMGAVTAAWRAGYQPISAEEARKWQYEAGVDISGRAGNTERFASIIQFSATLAGPDDQLKLYGSTDIAEQDGQTVSDEIKAGVDYSIEATERTSWYFRGEGEKDEIEQIDFRMTGAVGLGYDVIERPNQTLTGRLGLAYRYESYQTGRTSESPGLDVGLVHSYQISPWASMNNRLTYTPAFEDFGNYRMTHESSIDLPLAASDAWRLRLGLSNEYNSRPLPGKESLDTMYFTRLLLLWR